MGKWAKRTGYALLALFLLGMIITVIGKMQGERKMRRTVDVRLAALAVAPDPGRVEHGRYLYATRGCAECHGANGAGKTVVQDGKMLVVAPNITTGPHGVTAGYKVQDWVRTVRHGVKPNGNPVIVMPSEDYARLSDEDMAALVAFLQQMPPVAGARAVVQLPVPVKALYAFGLIKDASEKIDHSLPPLRTIAAAVTPDYGAYLANSCTGCHGARLEGGRIPGSPPSWPPAARLAAGKGSAMVRYATPEQFIAMLKSGRRPDGSAISPVMPFGSFGQMNDTDMRALYAYLKAAPAPALAQR